MDPVSESLQKRSAVSGFPLPSLAGRGDCTIMMLDIDEWYLLFLPQFESYLKPIKPDRRNNSVSIVFPAPEPLAVSGKTLFFQYVAGSRPTRHPLADEK